MADEKPRTLADLAKPLRGTATRVELSPEESERLNKLFELSPEARRDIEELQRWQRESLWRLRFMPPLGWAA